MDMTDAAYRIAVEDAIRSRWATERWYRGNRWAAWHDLRSENIAALRALLEIRRTVRRIVDPSLGHANHERIVADCRGCQKYAREYLGAWTDPKG